MIKTVVLASHAGTTVRDKSIKTGSVMVARQVRSADELPADGASDGSAADGLHSRG